MQITKELLLDNDFQQSADFGYECYNKYIKDDGWVEIRLIDKYSRFPKSGRNWYIKIDDSDCNTLVRAEIDTTEQFMLLCECACINSHLFIKSE